MKSTISRLRPQIIRLCRLTCVSAVLCLAISPGFAKDSKPPKDEKKPPGMVWVPGGSFIMGSAHFNRTHPEEAPEHEVRVDGFWMDETEVTNAQFAKFVEATKYVTVAEKAIDFKKLGIEIGLEGDPTAAEPGALIFQTPDERLEAKRDNVYFWWGFVKGADWRHPAGPRSSLKGRESHPVVCVTYEDAEAYAKWADKRLPTEAEWEFASRGGKQRMLFCWGDEIKPGKKWLANVWQGDFPNTNTKDDGYETTAPAKQYPANPYGLYEMAGNVWEICKDWYDPEYYTRSPKSNPRGPETPLKLGDLYPREFQENLPRRVVRGGSFLCHESYCLRFRPAARHHADSITPTNHTGFRCVQYAKGRKIPGRVPAKAGKAPLIDPKKGNAEEKEKDKIKPAADKPAVPKAK